MWGRGIDLGPESGHPTQIYHLSIPRWDRNGNHSGLILDWLMGLPSDGVNFGENNLCNTLIIADH